VFAATHCEGSQSYVALHLGFKKVCFLILALFLFGSAMAHDPINWNGDTIHVLVDKEDSGGDLGIFTVEVSAPGGPPVHIHEDAGEAFYLLSGEAEVLVGSEMFTISEGESIWVPKGVEHSFRILGETGGKLMVIVTPGGFEGFFAATKDITDPAEIERISVEEFSQIFTGPPLGAE